MGKKSRRERPGASASQMEAQERSRLRALEQSAQVRALRRNDHCEKQLDSFALEAPRATLVDRARELEREERLLLTTRNILAEVVRVGAPVCRQVSETDDSCLVSTVGMPLMGHADLLCGWPKRMAAQAAKLVGDIVAGVISGGPGPSLNVVVDNAELALSYRAVVVEGETEPLVPGFDMRVQCKERWPFEGPAVVMLELLSFYSEDCVLPGCGNAAPMRLRNVVTGETERTDLVYLPRPSASYAAVGATFSVARLQDPDGPPSGPHVIIPPNEFDEYPIEGKMWVTPAEERYLSAWGIEDYSLMALQNTDILVYSEPPLSPAARPQ